MAVLVQAAFQSYYMIVSFELEWQVGECRKPAPITIMGRGIAIAICSKRGWSYINAVQTDASLVITMILPVAWL